MLKCFCWHLDLKCVYPFFPFFQIKLLFFLKVVQLLKSTAMQTHDHRLQLDSFPFDDIFMAATKIL